MSVDQIVEKIRKLRDWPGEVDARKLADEISGLSADELKELLDGVLQGGFKNVYDPRRILITEDYRVKEEQTIKIRDFIQENSDDPNMQIIIQAIKTHPNYTS